MSSALEIILVVIEILEFTAGVWGNGFIMLATCVRWIKTKNISLFDFALLCLSVSRIGVMGAVLPDSVGRVFYPGLLERRRVLRIIIHCFWNVNSSLGMWCSICFSILYFLTLSHFSHPLLLWLKWRKEKVAGTALLGFLLSLLFHLLSVGGLAFGISDDLETGRNWTWKMDWSQGRPRSHQVFLLLGLLIPLPVLLVSFSLLAFSLWKHMQQMRHRAEASRDLNAQVHARARRRELAFLVLLAVHYLDTLLIVWSSSTTDTSANVIVAQTVGLLYPALHPFILIRGNRNLRQASMDLLRRVESCFRSF